LGNVLVTISDKKIPVSSNNTTVDYYTADVVTANDYYPFGMQMPGRKFTQSNSSYRYGFNGMEKDNSTGEGNLDFGARIYDSRLGRWLAVDPLAYKYPELTPYCFVANNPILYIDPDGRELILSFASAGAMTSYTNIVNSALGGKYQANLVAIAGTSNYRVEITTIDAKAKINSEQKSFYKNLNKVVTAKDVVNQSVVENDANVVVDSWQTNQIDIKDIEGHLMQEVQEQQQVQEH
jgi:RHS repeat-associated protein